MADTDIETMGRITGNLVEGAIPDAFGYILVLVPVALDGPSALASNLARDLTGAILSQTCMQLGGTPVASYESLMRKNIALHAALGVAVEALDAANEMEPGLCVVNEDVIANLNTVLEMTRGDKTGGES